MRQILDWKIQRVRFWVKNFSTCQVLKNCFHPRNHVMVQFTPRKPLTLYFWCFSKEHDFEVKISKRVRFWFKKFYEASDCGLKEIQRVWFWIKNFWTCQFLKKCFHPKNHVLVQFTPWKRDISHFWCCFKSMILKWNFSKRVTFQFKGSTARQIWDWKKYIFKVVLNVSCYPSKKTQHVRVSVKNYTTIERRLDGWQLPVVHLVNKSATNIVF